MNKQQQHFEDYIKAYRKNLDEHAEINKEKKIRDEEIKEYLNGVANNHCIDHSIVLLRHYDDKGNIISCIAYLPYQMDITPTKFICDGCVELPINSVFATGKFDKLGNVTTFDVKKGEPTYVITPIFTESEQVLKVEVKNGKIRTTNLGGFHTRDDVNAPITGYDKFKIAKNYDNPSKRKERALVKSTPALPDNERNA